MKQLIALALLTLVLAVSATRSEAQWRSSFDKWCSKYNKVYNGDAELGIHFQIFKENAQYIWHHNHKSKSTYTLGLNEFADLTDEEFSQRYLLRAPQPNCSATKGTHTRNIETVPSAVDWRQKGVVSAVKNQGSCGSCWTFSTTGAMEAHWTLYKGDKKLFSEQQLVDCAQAFDNHGCNGGLPSHAFEYIRYNGLTTEDQYPYKAVDQKCKYIKSMGIGTSKGSQNITQGSEGELVDAIANAGPVSIAFEVVGDFRFYKNGVYSSKTCKSGPGNVNHAVLAVGYNTTETGVPYYIIKNSWGTSFGIDGYFWMVRDKNMCGVSTCASYPLV